MNPDDVDTAGPVPWTPVGRLMPAPGRAGEWHSLPLTDDSHDFTNCPCDPDLHTSVSQGELRAVWVHKDTTRRQ